MNHVHLFPSKVKNALLVTAVASLLLSGCSANVQPLPENSPPPSSTVPTAVSSDGTASSSEIPENKSAGTKDYLDLGFNLLATELHSVLGGFYDAETMLSVYGKPESSTDPVVWGADGLEHQSWSYPSKGLSLDFVKDDSGIFKADAITIAPPSPLRTARGIGIGSSRKEVLKAYEKEIDPKEVASEPDQIVAGTVYGGVIFTLDNGKVTSIFIGAAAE